MNRDALERLGIVLTLAAVVALGIVLWTKRPEQGALWTIAMCIPFAAMLAYRVFHRVRGVAPSNDTQSSVRRSVATISGSMVLALGWILLSTLGWNEGEQGVLLKRALGVITGAFLMVSGNYVPKSLVPLDSARCNPTAGQTARRFAGWTLVLTGIATIVMWLLAPVKIAAAVSLTLIGAALVTVLTKCSAAKTANRVDVGAAS